VKNGWQTKKLGDVATLQRGFDLPTQDRVSGEFPLVSSSGVIDTHDKRGVCGPGVVTGRSGSIGNVFFIEDDFWPLNTVLYVKDFHGNDPRFIFHLLKKFDLKRFASGAGVPTLNRNFVHDELVNVPPLPEQQRIVGILDEAFDGIATAKANAEKNLQNARALFESHLQAVFTQRGERWVEKRLREVAESISTGPFGTMLHKSDYVPNGIPLVNPMNIVDSHIVPSSKMMVNEETRERLHGYVLKAGDIVIGRRGELGRCALITEREDGWLCGTGSFFVRLSDCMDGKFFVALFGSRQFKARLEGSAVGTTMSSLNHTILNDLTLPVPPVALQREIMTNADKLSSEIQRLESIYRRKLAALDELKKSLLHKAFNGEL
jgi:type I restriction enzyme S subunit